MPEKKEPLLLLDNSTMYVVGAGDYHSTNLSFEEAKAVADNLNEKRTVVLNLESANRDVARRLVDFLSGVAYANGGKVKRVATRTFIITPYNVDLTGDDLIDELEGSGVYF